MINPLQVQIYMRVNCVLITNEYTKCKKGGIMSLMEIFKEQLKSDKNVSEMQDLP